MPKDLTIADSAIRLILEFEGFTGRVDWPGGMSDPTWGIGYDGGYHTAVEIRRDWSPHLPGAAIALLVLTANVKGRAAQALVKQLKGVTIPREAADAVFRLVDIPRWIRRTDAAFPGYDGLPDDIQGALVSLTFNRGTRMADSRHAIKERREMRAIRDAVANLEMPLDEKRLEIVAQLRSMKRLWTGELPAPYNVRMGGLIRRREAEARLAEASGPASTD